MDDGGNIAPVAIEEEMQRSYLDYAMSVIVSRAIPDARDGLKPVHRRILFSMHESGYTSDKPYRKSARVVGDVMGRYHPHGDQAIYDAMVRMAQDFAMRLPLLDGQGNFGSMDGDPPAAMRYTEVRMDKTAEMLLQDIDKDTVDFQDNYDGSASEPVVLPAMFPNLLVNGAGGIAVGMATNIPPHNLGEVIDACCAFLDNREVAVEDLMQFVKGPDFPTGGLILGRGGILSAFRTGRGSIVMRGRRHVEEVRKDREAIVVTEIPYQVNKAGMIEKIAEAVRAKRIEGISDLRDESDRNGVRVVIELKRDAMAEVVLNQLYRFSQLQTSFGVNSLALNHGRPELLNLRDLVAAFVDSREVVVTRRTRHLLGKARERAHVLAGLAIAVANIDEIIALIRKAPDPATARAGLMAKAWPARDVEAMIQLIDEPGRKVVDGVYRLSEAQARAILDLRLQRLTALGRDEIGDELKSLGEKILDYLDILRSRDRLTGLIRQELLDMKERFGTPRRSEIVEGELDQDDEDLIQPEDMVVTVSHNGYVKRVPLSTYRPQRRGGKGRQGMSTRDEDFVARVFVANTHTSMLFFSSVGKVYKLKVYRLPQGAPQARGKAMVNLFPLEENETIHTVLPLPDDEDEWTGRYVVFATASGSVRRNDLADFRRVQANGKIAMKLPDGDRIVGVAICGDRDDILLAGRQGKCIRFPVIDVRVFKSRDSVGVRGIRLIADDVVIAMSILRHTDVAVEDRDTYLRWSNARRRAASGEDGGEPLPPEPAQAEAMESQEQFILSITENGYGKRSSAYEYRVSGRGGQGIINIETSDRNGPVIASAPVAEGHQIMLVTDTGRLIRTPVHDIRIAGRNTQGVTLFDVEPNERVVSVAWLTEKANGGGNGDNGGEPDGAANGEADGDGAADDGGEGSA
ncbi:MAG: DNA gyrase subunit A [Alphaproteobacteria bacterium]|nr:DNA gyrase subunit A [Alphaproteobacteria bacterium]MDP6812988.1 DNA gyrase subunit A [Alphaproteobacteria bacterium]